MAEKSYLIKKSPETPTSKFVVKVGKLTPSIVSLKGTNGKAIAKSAYTTKQEGSLFVIDFVKPTIFFIEIKLS